MRTFDSTRKNGNTFVLIGQLALWFVQFGPEIKKDDDAQYQKRLIVLSDCKVEVDNYCDYLEKRQRSHNIGKPCPSADYLNYFYNIIGWS